MEVYERGVHVCQEFTDFVLLDKTRMSIVINVDLEFFKTIKKEMQKIGYRLMFTKPFKDINSITCAFELLPKKNNKI